MLAMPAFNLASGALRSLFVDRLDDNPDPLVLAEVEIGRWLEDPIRIDGFGESRHRRPVPRILEPGLCRFLCRSVVFSP